MRFITALIALVAACNCNFPARPSQEPALAQVQSLQYSVVKVTCKGGHGSGVITEHRNGYTVVATAKHVIEGCDGMEIEGRASISTIISEDHDIGYIVVKGYLGTPARLRTEALGERVYAVGYPYDQYAERGVLALSEGVVVSTFGSMLRTTAVISPGSSGGGLFGEDGRLIGITVMGYRTAFGVHFYCVPARFLVTMSPPVPSPID